MTTTTLTRSSNPVAWTAATLCLLVGGLVLACYVSGAVELLRMTPWSAPMRLPTSLGAVFCGLALAALAAGWKKSAVPAAVLAGLTGLEMLGEAVLGLPVHAVEARVIAASDARATSLAAVCLLLASAAFLLMVSRAPARRRLAAVGLLGSLLASIGTVTLLCYPAGISDAFSSGGLTKMSPLTALCLAAIGAAVIRFAWRDSLSRSTGTPEWLPLLVGVVTLTISVSLSQAIVAEQHSELNRRIAADLISMRTGLEAEWRNRVQPLIRLARRRAAAAALTREEWDADVNGILTRGGYQGIQWVDAAGRAAWATPPGGGDAMPDGSVAFEERRRTAMEAARRARVVAVTRPVSLVGGGLGVLVFAPVFAGEECVGFVTGVFRNELLFAWVLDSSLAPHYSLAIQQGGEELYRREAGPRQARWRREEAIGGYGEDWRFVVWPGENMLAAAQSSLPGALLIVGGALAALLALLVRLVQQAAGQRPAAEVSSPEAVHPEELSRMPSLSYDPAGIPLSWNDAARALFPAAPPPIAPAVQYRVLRVAIVRSEPGDALRAILDSCTLPAVAFSPGGAFRMLNRAALSLGWNEEVWKDLRVSPGAAGFEASSVLLVQGQTPVA